MTLRAVSTELEGLTAQRELIVIDDGSTDETWSVLETASDKIVGLRAARFSRNFGKEAAIGAGLRMARGRAVIVMDGDLQHPPDLIPQMVRLWSETGADVVEAVKADRATESFIGRMRARLFYSLLNRLSEHDLAGAVFALFSVVLGVHTLGMKITGEAVDGFTTVILLLLIIGSLLMFSLGIIGSYIARIFEEVKRRPRYVIAQMLNPDESPSPAELQRAAEDAA